MPNGNVHIIAKLRTSRSSIMLIQLRIKNSGKFEAKKGLLKNCALISLKYYEVTKDLHKKYRSGYV